MSDPCLVIKSVMRHARISHRCCECFSVIRIGEEYRHSSGIDADHDPFSYKQCAICSEVFEAAEGVADPDEWPCFTQLRDWLGDYIYSSERIEESVQSMVRDLKVSEEKIRHVLGL